MKWNDYLVFAMVVIAIFIIFATAIHTERRLYEVKIDALNKRIDYMIKTYDDRIDMIWDSINAEWRN